jgi:hypothetical protein
MDSPHNYNEYLHLEYYKNESISNFTKMGVFVKSIERMSFTLQSIYSYENIITLLPEFKEWDHNFNPAEINTFRLNLLNRNVFLVKDLIGFIKLIRINVDMHVNAGIQK